jgi:hypothetical protein
MPTYLNRSDLVVQIQMLRQENVRVDSDLRKAQAALRDAADATAKQDGGLSNRRVHSAVTTSSKENRTPEPPSATKKPQPLETPNRGKVGGVKTPALRPWSAVDAKARKGRL